MSINSYLKNLGSALVIKSDEKQAINRSVDTLVSRANIYFGAFEGCFVFGSYTRGTILPRKADEHSDVDIMMVFDSDEDYKPQTYLNRIKEFAKYYYPLSIVHQDRPSVVLDMNHIRFEMTPGKAYGGIDGWYYIPLDSSTWQITKPNAFNDKLVQCNNNNAYKAKPVIRLMKHWNVNKNYHDMPSFKLEDTLIDALMNRRYTCTSYTEYLLASFEAIRWSTDSSRVANAIYQINKAINEENEGYPLTALGTIKSIFPEV